jgi:CheY-like chemotaxis protein
MKPETILLVEDELIIGHDLRNRLLMHGYHNVELTNSGTEALNIVEKSGPPDMVLMDISLEDKKYFGLAIARKIKKYYDIPIVFLSGHADLRTRRYAEKISSSGYLTKPINLSDLYFILEAAYTHYREKLKIKQEKER